MALVVETGVGITNADSYSTRAAFIAYVLAQYNETVPDDDATDTAIRRAAGYMDSLRWKGVRTNGRAQGLAWPRSGVTDCEGIAIADDEIPTEVIAAQHEFARAELTAPGVLSPQGNILDAIRNRAKVDVIEVGYDTSRILPDFANLEVRVSAAMRRIECFVFTRGRMTDARVV